MQLPAFRIPALLLSLVFVLVYAPGARAQGGAVDPSFNNGTGFSSGWVGTIATQPDGKILLGGLMNTFADSLHWMIARVNADGSRDAGFRAAARLNGNVFAIAVQADGRIIAGGSFSQVAGAPSRNRIIRFHPDGAVDSSFTVGTGFNDQVNALTLQTDGKVLVGGWFSSYNGVACTGMVRLLQDGSLDTSFHAGIATIPVQSIVLGADGRMLIGGMFQYFVNNVGRRGVARLHPDGSLDSSFNPGTGGDFVSSLAVHTDGKVYVGGGFTSFNGVNRKSIVRLQANGSVDAAFNPSSGPNNSISMMLVQPDGRLLVAGSFNQFNGQARGGLVRVNANGALDNTFQLGTGANSGVSAIVLQAGGKLLLGGSFSSINGVRKNTVARVNANGSVDAAFGVGTGANYTGNVMALQVLPDGKMMAGGTFGTYDGRGVGPLARLHADGTLDTTFRQQGLSSVYGLAVQADGKVIPAGSFFGDGAYRRELVRLNPDGKRDSSFNPGSGPDNLVRTVAVQPDGKILVGGWFSYYNGVRRSYFARINADGSIDNSFNPSGSFANAPIACILLQPDGKILLGGSFSQYNTIPVNGIVRLNPNGQVDGSFQYDGGVDGTVFRIALQPDGKILIGGIFNTYAGTSANGVARLLPNGVPDPTFSSPLSTWGAVRGIAVQADGKIVIGGQFRLAGSSAVHHVVRLLANGTVDAGFHTEAHPDSDVNVLELQADGGIVAGGLFEQFGAYVRRGLVRLSAASISTAISAPALLRELAIGPNPVQGTLRISDRGGFTGVYSVALFDSQGRELRRGIRFAGTGSIDMGGLPAGTYLVEIRKERTGERVLQKIVKR